MLDWSHYRDQLLKAIGDLGRLSPQTVRGYRELSDAGTKTARLDAKTRELIALAVGVTRQCDGCITTHVHAARVANLSSTLSNRSSNARASSMRGRLAATSRT
jgi:AhpD family alkylhydroperoxidase